MVERFNSFGTTEYVEFFIAKFQQKQEQDIQQQQALQENVEQNIQGIHSRAEDYEVLHKIFEDLAKGLKGGYDLIASSNDFAHYYEDCFAKMHNMMQSRNGNKRAKFFNAQLTHERKSKPGWGRYGNQTREQIQPSVDRSVQNKINRELNLAQEEDRKNHVNGQF